MKPNVMVICQYWFILHDDNNIFPEPENGNPI